MNTSKIIKGVVSNGRYTVTAPIVKEDYGLYLQIEGVELPSTYEVDFSNSESNGTSVTMIGNADGVLIPHQFVDTGKDIFAFLYHVGANYGRTVYKFRIPNKVRPDRTNEQPTPEEQSVIDQTISALNDAVESAQDAQEAIENMSVSATTLAEGESATVTKTESEGVVHLTFGIPTGATGAQGERGERVIRVTLERKESKASKENVVCKVLKVTKAIKVTREIRAILVRQVRKVFRAQRVTLVLTAIPPQSP